MRGRTLAFLGLFGWTGGCTAQAESIHDDTLTDTGGTSSGGSSTGGNANKGGTSFLDEGEILLGSCLFTPPTSTQCQDYVTRAEHEATTGYYECVRQHEGDTLSFVEWRGGEHCPLEGAELVCKGNVRISYFYGDDTWTAEQAEEGCQTGDGYGVPVYWRSEGDEP